MLSKVLMPDVNQFSESSDEDVRAIRVDVNGKSIMFKVKGSKNPQKRKTPSHMNIFVPLRILGSSLLRNSNNGGTQDVEYESEELESLDPDDNGKGRHPKVDLGKKTCSCCFWDLVGIPCRHAVPVMHYQNLNPELYVDSCSMRDANKLCYENNVSPVNGMNMWSNVDVEDMLPPQYKKGPGRPKKLRFKEHDETWSRMRRSGVT
ncbi:hypothetical protein KIW84_063796 [Lathyrus oleraceus]|uniref:SWIM-type domain-containing protein n=1 Tax=Pisum sativum TaxID=3888 RepID=A0A9D5A7S0_PEA|nr:hypothetical protein KIW84_063796 [Pisum sativum]